MSRGGVLTIVGLVFAAILTPQSLGLLLLGLVLAALGADWLTTHDTALNTYLAVVILCCWVAPIVGFVVIVAKEGIRAFWGGVITALGIALAASVAFGLAAGFVRDIGCGNGVDRAAYAAQWIPITWIPQVVDDGFSLACEPEAPRRERRRG